MPDPSTLIQPPYLNPTPENMDAYMDALRKQQLVSMLVQNTQQAAQTPTEWNSMRVVPKRSPLSNALTLASALMAGQAYRGANQAQGAYLQKLMGGNTPAAAPQTPSQPPASMAPPLIRDDAQTSGQAADSVPVAAIHPDGPGYGLAKVPPSPALSQSAQSAMLLPGTDMATSQRMLTMMGPQEYAKVLAGQYAPTDLQKMLRAAGASPTQEKQALEAAIAKATTNVQDLRPGGTAFDLTTRQPIFSAPQNGQQVQWGPSGPLATVLPNAPQAAAAMTAAETGARTANTPAVIPTKGGGSTYGYPSDVIGPPPGLRNPGTAVSPGVQAPRVGQPFAATSNAPSGPPGSPWAGMPKLPIGQGIGAPDAFSSGRLQEAGKKDAELSSKYGTEADLADQKLQYNAQASQALPNAEVGPLSEWLTHNRQALIELGVPPGLVPSSGTVTPTLELNKNLANAALQSGRAIFPRLTQMETKMLKEEMSPSPTMTRDAIASLIQQDNIKQQYAKQRSQDYGQYIQNKGDPLRFESWYAKNFPLTRFAAKATTPPAALDRLQQNPALSRDFQAKYGWTPYPGE